MHCILLYFQYLIDFLFLEYQKYLNYHLYTIVFFHQIDILILL